MLALVGGMLAVFGLYRLGAAKEVSAGDGRLARLLLDFFDPMSATLVESYLAMIFGALVAGLGLYIFFGGKS
jgi:hypothetical protein